MFVGILVAVALCLGVTYALYALSQASKAMRKAAASKMRISSITIYPVKSCAGVAVQEASLDGVCGLSQDRQWMVVDARGAFLSQRRAPKLALVTPTLPREGEPLSLRAPGAEPIEIPVVEDANKTKTVRCWDDRVEAVDQGDAAAAWFSSYLGIPGARLVRMPRSSVRAVDPRYAPRGARTAFSDGFPLLLASTKSLDDLNRRISLTSTEKNKKKGAQDPLPMNRFRPNVVVDNAPEPWAEDAWKKVAIGTEAFLVAKPCARCKMPTIDQATGVPGGERTSASRASKATDDDQNDDEGGGPNAGVEPTATMQTFRTGKALGYAKPSWQSEVFFGQNLCHLSLLPPLLERIFGDNDDKGIIKVGDGLAVLS